MESTITSDVRGYMAVLHKRRALIAACTLVGLLAALAYNSAARPVYQATVVLLLQTETPNLLGSRPAIERRRGIEALNTQFQILGGRRLAEQVVSKLGLQSDPEFLAGPLVTPWERLQRDVLGRRRPAEGAEVLVSPILPAFRSRLSIEPVEKSSLVHVRFRAYDPQVATKAVNMLAQLYIEQTVRSHGDESSRAQGWLSDRLGEQKEAIGRSEGQVRDYERQQGLLNLEERQRLAEQKLSTIHGALVSARTERISKETAYAQLQGLSPQELMDAPEVQKSPLAAELRVKLSEQERALGTLADSLGERHPDLLKARAELVETQRRLREEATKVLRAAEAEARLAARQEQNLQADLEPVQQEINELRQKAVQYGMLKREAEANQAVLKNLINRSKETGLEGEIPVREVRVVERAEVPTSPVSPRRGRNYQIALAAGLGLGIALTLLLEQMDDSLRTPDDVKRFLEVPFLGMVPDAARSGTRTGSTSPLILSNLRSPLAEAYRVIRTNLIFSSTQPTGRAVMISSVNPAEGKSTTVVNLAASLAQNGAQVLVIDGDLRRPVLHTTFDVQSAPGLSDTLVGRSTLVEAIRPGVVKGVDLLPCGYVPPNPAELLGSPRMRELVLELREVYDWVLIDAPPILTMADAPVLSPVVDGMVVVVAAERTARHAVVRALEQVTGVGGTILGIVLNRVDLQRNSYYFGRYYGDYYRSYYQDRTAVKPPEKLTSSGEPQRRM